MSTTATTHQAESSRPPVAILVALALGVLLAALDQTIVATALPTVAGIEHISQLDEKELTMALRRTQQYRNLLYGLGGLLLAGTVTAAPAAV